MSLRVIPKITFRSQVKRYIPFQIQTRNLNLLEHNSFKLLKDAGIPVPKFAVAKTPEEAKKAAADLKTKDMVVKAQVLCGGRGKGVFKNGFKGGVKMAATPEEVEELAKKMLKQVLVTKQTGEGGRMCNKIMIAERKYPRKEYFVAVMMERTFGGPVLLASAQGGVDIEDVAAENPKAIIYEAVDVMKGVSPEQTCKMAKAIGLGKHADFVACVLQKMYALFVQKDALLIEMNPFVEDSKCGESKDVFFGLDCKMLFDDNAQFRQKELFALRDWSQEDPKEVQAAKFDLNYIALDGNIGCMVNGAGLAMATMDICALHGGRPANFLDVGGAATKETVTEAFKIITTDENVNVIFINIFGGIMRCDIIAQGIITAAKELKLKIPLVVRLEGTNVEEARKAIAESKLKIITRDDFDSGAKLSVQLSQIMKIAKEANVDVDITMKPPPKEESKCAAPPPPPACPPPPPPACPATPPAKCGK